MKIWITEIHKYKTYYQLSDELLSLFLFYIILIIIIKIIVKIIDNKNNSDNIDDYDKININNNIYKMINKRPDKLEHKYEEYIFV
jgi:hypothetical protein